MTFTFREITGWPKNRRGISGCFDLNALKLGVAEKSADLFIATYGYGLRYFHSKLYRSPRIKDVRQIDILQNKSVAADEVYQTYITVNIRRQMIHPLTANFLNEDENPANQGCRLNLHPFPTNGEAKS